MHFVHIDMTAKTVAVQPVPDAYADLGGRGLTSIMINDSVPAECDPLGPDNLLIFAPGFLSGTPLVNTGRLSIGGKSPLTGGVKEANVGGTMALALARLGIRAVVVQGQAQPGELFAVVISKDGEVELVDASTHAGKRNYALAAELLEEYGEKHSIALTGPAGEQGLKSASIQATDPDGTPCRAAARGGLGAVMASKGLKALAVSREGTTARAMPKTPLMNDAARSFAANIKRDGWASGTLPQFGTASILANTNASGALPTRNATQGSFELADEINGDVMHQRIASRGGQTTHKGCSRCIINCSNVYVDESGKPVTSALEYETMWSMGAMTCIGDLDAVARLDFLCDDIGLDTMNTGTALAVAMDAGHLEFGDAEGAIRLVEEVAEGTDMGRLIGHGPDAVGAHFRHARVPTIKGQSIAGYDPRAMPGMGVTYATSTQGGDHTAGFIGGARGSSEQLRRMSASSQANMAVVDAMGVCMFAQSGGQENMHKAVTALLGSPFGPAEWDKLGKRILKAELDFNRRAGLTDADDQLPAMFHTEPLSATHGVAPYPEEDLHGTLERL